MTEVAVEHDSPIVREIVAHIVETMNPEKIILFGSWARGEASADSDLDILVIQETDRPFETRGLEAVLGLRHLKLPLDLITYTPEEWREVAAAERSFEASLAREGRTLYERS